MTVNFKFEVDDIIITPLGEKAIIVGCYLDNTNINQYNCMISGGNNQWFREDQLKKED